MENERTEGKEEEEAEEGRSLYFQRSREPSGSFTKTAISSQNVDKRKKKILKQIVPP